MKENNNQKPRFNNQNQKIALKTTTVKRTKVTRPENKKMSIEEYFNGVAGSAKKTELKKKNSFSLKNTKVKKPKIVEKMKVIPIGGVGEIGKNMTVFEYKDEIIIIDCGLKFPDDAMYGIDMVLPDFSYVIENRDKVKGLIITHGHEDHIGGIAYLLKEINVPIYATKIAMGFIDKKLVEHNLASQADRRFIEAGKKYTIGKFEIETVRVNHSIADSLAICVRTLAATIFHTGDFKIDFCPIDGEIIDLQRIAAIGHEGVDLLLADSTNVEEQGFTGSESTIGNTFHELFKGCKNRIIVTTFASHIHRVQQIINAAVFYNRKVIIHGRSMENMVEIASDLGYLKVPSKAIIDIKDMKNYRDQELVIITTGSQGEPMAALGRMASGEHKLFNITEHDTIIISASPVPGNEKTVAEVINKLIALGSDVIYNKFATVHVSGHARREELKMMQTLIKPKNFMPVHGEARMLMHHGELAEKLGLNKKNIFIQENGDVLEVSRKGITVTGKVPAEAVLVDGLGVGDIGNVVLNDRKKLSEDGLLIVAVGMRGNKAVSGPEIISRGFVYMRESEDLINETREEAKKALKICEDKRINDWNAIRNEIRANVNHYLFKKTQRRPMILPILMDVKE